MMTRGHVTESLSAYLDEQVSAAERERIEAHLRGCDACRTHLESLRHSVALVRGADPVPAPAGFQAAVRSKVAASAPGRTAPRVPRLHLSWKTAGAMAAVLLIGIFSVNLLREIRPQYRLGQDAASRGAGPQGITLPGPAPASPERSLTTKGAAPGATDVASPSGLPTLRQIIRTAHVQLAVDDFDATLRALVGIAEGAGGFVASSSYSQRGRAPEGVFTLRVPASKFAQVLLDVERLGTVETRRMGGQDVTEEFVDLSARVRNLERHEQRLLSFMEHATKVTDLLAIEQELSRVRGEIEMLTGRLRFLGNQVELATVEVAMRQKVAPVSGGFWDFGATLGRMKAAFLTTIRQILGAAERVAVVGSALVPVAVLAVVVWLAIRRIRLRTV